MAIQDTIDYINRQIRSREELKFASVQKWRGMRERKRLWNSISEYDKEIFTLCQAYGLDEYKLVDEFIRLAKVPS